MNLSPWNRNMHMSFEAISQSCISPYITSSASRFIPTLEEISYRLSVTIKIGVLCLTIAGIAGCSERKLRFLTRAIFMVLNFRNENKLYWIRPKMCLYKRNNIWIFSTFDSQLLKVIKHDKCKSYILRM